MLYLQTYIYIYIKCTYIYMPIWSSLIVFASVWRCAEHGLIADPCCKSSQGTRHVPPFTIMVYVTIGELSCQVETMSDIIPLRSPVKKWSAGLLQCHAKHIECGSVWAIWMIWIDLGGLSSVSNEFWSDLISSSVASDVATISLLLLICAQVCQICGLKVKSVPFFGFRRHRTSWRSSLTSHTRDHQSHLGPHWTTIPYTQMPQ